MRANDNSKRVLIISYIFPPYPGIGGRRWAKFAKYLTREGYEVHLICAISNEMEKSVWMNDVLDNQKIFIHDVNAFFPKSFTRRSKTIVDKLIYKFWQFSTPLIFPGYIYDRSIYSGHAFVNKARSVISHYNISNVVVTGAPFRLVYHITKLMKRWPRFRLFADFRDPWTWEPEGHYQRLSKQNLDYEKKMERFVMQHADFIMVPTAKMLQHLQGFYPAHIEKCKLLSHAWDEDEIKPNFKIKEDIIRLTWYGTLYNNLDSFIKPLAAAIATADGKIVLDIFSDSTRYKELFVEAGGGPWVNYYSLMPSKELYLLVKNYKASIIINNDSDKDHVSTKFIELAASQTPVIYIANDGVAADFVKQNGLGWHLPVSMIPVFFEELQNGTIEKPVSSLNINSLSFKNVTSDLITIIETEK